VFPQGNEGVAFRQPCGISAGSGTVCGPGGLKIANSGRGMDWAVDGAFAGQFFGRGT